jgi:phage gpG-like protein
VPGDDRLWRELRRKVIEMGAEGAHVKIGVLSSKGGEQLEGGITMLELAAIHEFGSPTAGIPERSFIRFTMRNRKDEIAAQITKVAKAFVADKVTLEQGLGVLGAWAAGAVKKSITSKEIKQDLKPETIARKGSSTALVDTGRLLQAITWQVQLRGAAE